MLTQLYKELDILYHILHRNDTKISSNVRNINQVPSIHQGTYEMSNRLVNLRENKFAKKESTDAKNLMSALSKGKRRNTELGSFSVSKPQTKEFWYPVEFSAALRPDQLVPFCIFEEQWVLYLCNDGRPICIKDSCAHRACPLSLGKIENNEVACAYHGWTFAYDGNCTVMPSTVYIKDIGVDALPCVNVAGIIWVYPGVKIAPPLATLNTMKVSTDFRVHSELLLDHSLNNKILLSNLTDFQSATAININLTSQKWSVPQSLFLTTVSLIKSNWYLHPKDLSFIPPCTLLSTIGISQLNPIKGMTAITHTPIEYCLKQFYVCLPMKKTSTRILYRMSLNFMPWGNEVPFINSLWTSVAKQVVRQELNQKRGNVGNVLERPSRGLMMIQVPYEVISSKYHSWKLPWVEGLRQSR